MISGAYRRYSADYGALEETAKANGTGIWNMHQDKPAVLDPFLLDPLRDRLLQVIVGAQGVVLDEAIGHVEAAGHSLDVACRIRATSGREADRQQSHRDQWQDKSAPALGPRFLADGIGDQNGTITATGPPGRNDSGGNARAVG